MSGHVKVSVWVSPSHIEVIVRRRHVGDVCVVSHRERLNACKSIFPRCILPVAVRGILLVLLLWFFIFMTTFLIVRRVMSRVFSAVTGWSLNPEERLSQGQRNQLHKVCGLKAQMDVVDNT